MTTKQKNISRDELAAPRILAGSEDGVTEDLMKAHGVTFTTMLALVKNRLATAHVDQLARPRIEVTRLQITDLGREALTASQPTRA